MTIPKDTPEGHTPGPWDLDAGFLITRAFCGGIPIPLLQFEGRVEEAGDSFGWVTGKPGEHRANERLIAAAPELLDALAELDDALTDGLCNSGVPGFDPERLERARVAARAAIAKAKKP